MRSIHADALEGALVPIASDGVVIIGDVPVDGSAAVEAESRGGGESSEEFEATPNWERGCDWWSHSIVKSGNLGSAPE
jgi:hypothetical protein